MKNPTNNRRALWAYGAVESMAAKTMRSPEGEEIADKIRDLLCNIQHLCDAEGLNYDDLLDSARVGYREEIAGQEQANANYANN
jgi:hypothetical protein